MEYKTRLLEESDLNKLLKLNLSDIENWHKFNTIQGFTEQTEWEKLTPFERWMHGGPWLDPHTLEIHFNLVNDYGKIFVLENNKNELIGEADFIQSVEGEEQTQVGYILWFLIHPKYRKKGLGSKLLRESMKLFHNEYSDLNYFETVPEDQRSLILYQKCGYKIINEVIHGDIQIKGSRLDLELINKEGKINERELTSQPPTYDRISRVFIPTSNAWQAFRYSGKYANILKNPESRQIKAYDLTFQRYKAITTDSKQFYLWMEPKAKNKVEILKGFYQQYLSIISDLKNPPKKIFMDIWREDLPLIHKMGIKFIKEEKSQYMRLRINNSKN